MSDEEKVVGWEWLPCRATVLWEDQQYAWDNGRKSASHFQKIGLNAIEAAATGQMSKFPWYRKGSNTC